MIRSVIFCARMSPLYAGRGGSERSIVKVRLTRKLANRINGVDLTGRELGDVFQPSRHEATLLIAEGWAVPHAEDPGSRRQVAAASSTTPTPVAPKDDTNLKSRSLNGLVAAALENQKPHRSKKQRGPRQ